MTSTTDRNLMIRRLYQEGQTLAQVGKRFGITRERVRQLLVAQGEHTRTFTPKNCVSPVEAAAMFGRPLCTTRRVLAHCGVKPVGRVGWSRLWFTLDEVRKAQAWMLSVCCQACHKPRKRVLGSAAQSERFCKTCGQESSIRWKYSADYRKEQSERARRWREANREHWLATMRAYQRRRRAAAKASKSMKRGNP